MRVVETTPILRSPPGFIPQLVGNSLIGFPAQPIRFKSSILAPMYVDLRKILGSVLFRSSLLTFLQNASSPFVAALCKAPIRDVVFAGVATGAIPVPAMLADRLRVSFCYVRSDKKDHGLPAAVVGLDVQDKEIILFEDVVTMATSSALAVSALQAAGGQVKAIVSFFDYEFQDAAETLRNLNVPHVSLGCFTEVLQHMKGVDPNIAEGLELWHRDPWGWTEMMEKVYPHLARD